MDAISQTTFRGAFSWMKMCEFRLNFHWSLFPRVQLTIFQHWFRQWLGAVQATSHYLNQWWLDYRRIYASLGLNELIEPIYTVHPAKWYKCTDTYMRYIPRIITQCTKWGVSVRRCFCLSKFLFVDVLVCQLFGLSNVLVCRRFGLSTFRLVDILVCRRFGLSQFRSVDILVFRYFGLSMFWFVDFLVVDVSVCGGFLRPITPTMRRYSWQ